MSARTGRARSPGAAMDSYHRWMQVSAFATLGGCPAVNVPVGFDDKGRPMGMQLIGRPRGDARSAERCGRL